jgi:hypothetical protein
MKRHQFTTEWAVEIVLALAVLGLGLRYIVLPIIGVRV